LKNDVNLLSKVISKKHYIKKLIYVDVLQVTEENSRIWSPDPFVRGPDPRIRIRTVPKCHGSEALKFSKDRKVIVFS
jgi:hypothetical protein